MTLQTGNPEHRSLRHNMAEQMSVAAVVVIAIIIFAWRYVF